MHRIFSKETFTPKFTMIFGVLVIILFLSLWFSAKTMGINFGSSTSPSPSPSDSPVPTPDQTAENSITPTATPKASKKPIATKSPTPKPSATTSPTPTPTNTPSPTETPISSMTINGAAHIAAGTNAPAGTSVEVLINDNVCGSTTTREAPTGSLNFTVEVKSKTQQNGCGENGTIMKFKIGGQNAVQNMPFNPDYKENVILNVNY